MRPRVVAFGGGTGLSASLRALRLLDVDVCAVVTVADDGGSSGRLRSTRDLVPPGDLRKAMLALSDDTSMARVFGHRFDGSDELSGHPVGNLVLAGLMETLDDPVEAVAVVSRFLGVRGTVLPMSTVPLDIEGDIDHSGRSSTVRGQHNLGTSTGVVQHVRLKPDSPPACDQAVKAIGEADWLVFGPGSWYTSVIPHLLVPRLREAIETAEGKKVVVLNLVNDSETDGLSLAEHLVALRAYASGFTADVVVADTHSTGEPEPVRRAAQSLGARLLLASVAKPGSSGRHDCEALAAALREVVISVEVGK